MCGRACASLYATGLYRGIDVEGTRRGDKVTIIFKGARPCFLAAFRWRA